MMGRRLRVHVGALFLRLADQLHRLLRADVLDDHAGSRFLRQPHIPLYHVDLRLPVRAADPEMGAGLSRVDTVVLNKGRIFFMEADGHALRRRSLHGRPGGFLRQKRDSVVRKARRSRRVERLHVHQLLPLHSQGHVGAGCHMDGRLFPLFQHIAQGVRIVHAGLCVRHQHHRGHAPGCRRARAAVNVLLPGKARVPEMHMGVHQTGDGGQALRVQDSEGGGSLPGSDVLRDFYDFLSFDQDIPDSVRPGRRVDQMRVLDKKHGGLSFRRRWAAV